MKRTATALALGVLMGMGIGPALAFKRINAWALKDIGFDCAMVTGCSAHTSSSASARRNSSKRDKNNRPRGPFATAATTGREHQHRSTSPT